MKSTKCVECGNETFEKDSVCALCKKLITRMHSELIDLLMKDNIWNPGKNNIKLWENKKLVGISRK